MTKAEQFIEEICKSYEAKGVAENGMRAESYFVLAQLLRVCSEYREGTTAAGTEDSERYLIGLCDRAHKVLAHALGETATEV
jgi:hypothetical protein